MSLRRVSVSFSVVMRWRFAGFSRDDAKADENKKKTYVCTHIMQIAQKLGIFTFGSF